MAQLRMTPGSLLHPGVICNSLIGVVHFGVGLIIGVDVLSVTIPLLQALTLLSMQAQARSKP